MNKVMTRTKRQSGTRPPGRHDTRRPGRAASGSSRAAAPRSPQAPVPVPVPANNGSAPTAATRPVPRTPQPSQAPHPPQNPHLRPTDHFADLLLAVLSGRRPVHSMLRHTAGRAYDELVRLAERGPLRTTHGTNPVVRDIGYYVAAPGALEVFARIGAGGRLRAMAFRLETGPDHRWRCTAVELGGPRLPHPNDD